MQSSVLLLAYDAQEGGLFIYLVIYCAHWLFWLWCGLYVCQLRIIDFFFFFNLPYFVAVAEWNTMKVMSVNNCSVSMSPIFWNRSL